MRATAAGVLLDIDGCRSIGNPGEPMLPVYPARFILPPGETVVRITVEPDEVIELRTDLDVVPMPPQAPVGGGAPPAVRNESIYRSSNPHPFSRGALVTEQIAAGVRVAYVNVHPCTVVPAEKRILFSPSVRVTVETAPAPAQPRPTAPSRPGRSLRALGASGVLNPGALGAYESAAAATEPDQTDLTHCVIITSSELAQAFEPLAALKRECGLRTRIVDTDWIAAHYAGADLQMRIRAFITHAYTSWGTEYVLLGGDDEIIPHRGFYVKVGTTADVDIASDLYYSCLDGTWNADGDAYYGEPGEEDLIPEVCLGRLPVDSAAEIANVIAKISGYALSPVESHCTKAIMLGELLWSSGGVDTWGGDYKDEIRFGSSSWGFATAGVPSHFATASLYDRELGSWSAAQLLPLLNGGVNLVNHAGHANLHTVMRLGPADVPLLTNDGISAGYFICYSHGCYAASFDNRDNTGTVHAADCIGEELVTGPHGAVAFIGNTRFGWDAPGSTCGVSQFFDRQFFDAVFGEGKTRLGEALDDSRIDNIPYIAYDAVRWVYYSLCLLGDPSLAVWTGTPRQLAASYDSVLYEGQGGYIVRIDNDGGAVAGARVSLDASAPGLFCSAISDGSGIAVLDAHRAIEGPLLLSIVAPNHYPCYDTVMVERSAAYLCSIELAGIRDNPMGLTSGDGDGVAEPGERFWLLALFANTGLNPLTDVEIAVTSTDTTLWIPDGRHTAGYVAAGSSCLLDTAFTVEILRRGEGSRLVPLLFTIVSNEGVWKVPQLLPVSSPAIVLESWSITDAPHGNANGCLEAWEFQNLLCSYRNVGETEVRFPVLKLSTPDHAYAKVIKKTVGADAIPPGDTFAFDGELLWFVNEGTPPFTAIRLVLSLSAENAPMRSDTITVLTCGFGLDAAADAQAAFEHRAIVGMDQWHRSSEGCRSGPSCWKCGDAGEAAYSNMMESTLTLPPLCLFDGSTLTFWHRMGAETGTGYPPWALDAGVLEISQDNGATWKIVSPVMPYPWRASPFNTIFLAPYQRCWSGKFDWRLETFDLSAYRGPVLIRLHFASDEQRGFEGWYVEDIHVETVVPTDAGIEAPLAGAANRLAPAFPNPFNPATAIPFELAAGGHAELKIFDVAGRLVRTLLCGRTEAGGHRAVWDGRDDRENPVASGVYFCRFSTAGYSATTRLLLVR